MVLTALPPPGSLRRSRWQQKVGRRVWHGCFSVERVGHTEAAGRSRRETPASSPRAGTPWAQPPRASGGSFCAVQFGRPPAGPRKQFSTRSAASAPMQIVYVAPLFVLILCWRGKPCKLFWASLDDSGWGLLPEIVYVVRLGLATLVGQVASPRAALTHPPGALVRMRCLALVTSPARPRRAHVKKLATYHRACGQSGATARGHGTTWRGEDTFRTGASWVASTAKTLLLTSRPGAAAVNAYDACCLPHCPLRTQKTT